MEQHDAVLQPSELGFYIEDISYRGLVAIAVANCIKLSDKALITAKQVIISLSEAVVLVGEIHHTGRFAPSVWC